jgi:hypothetical protein
MDSWVQIIFWIAFTILIGSLVLEILPTRVTEGFQGLVGVGDSKFWAKLVPRRGDIGPELEQDGLLRDTRYFSDYADVQRFSAKTDFCRIVQQGNDEKNKFLACALGGTDTLSSTSFRSPSVREGFILGRDDYMRDVDGDGRDDYCRIMKKPSGDFRAECNSADDKGFSLKMVPDNSPPPEIEMLLSFYAGCVMWLRFRDDMVDYAENLYLNSSGGASVAEKPPRPDVTQGLILNGVNQYLRIGDDPYLNLGSTIQLRSVRAFHFWVRFDEFTNNAHIFDFGNGAGIDNVWCGILNRGNLGIDASDDTKVLLCGDPIDDVLPEPPSGAQPGEITTPQDLMETTSANVEEYSCEGFAVAPRKMPRTIPKALKRDGLAKTADMCYEIWDKDQRKMRIVIPNMFKKGEWTHVVITAEGTDSFRPDIAVYKNGAKVFVQPNGWLPQNSITEKNLIGKSNWSNVTSQYANKDELLKGALFDVRAYNTPVDKAVVKDSYLWGYKLLGLDVKEE